MRPTQTPIANTWNVNLETVLVELVTTGVKRISLELASQPDAQGAIRLLVRRVADGAASQPPPVALAPHHPLTLTCGRTNNYDYSSMREACKP